MENQIIYIESKTSDFFCAYNPNNLTEIRLFDNQIMFEKHESYTAFDWSLKYYYDNKDFKVTTRERFDEYYKSQTELLNEISKEL